MGIDPEVNRNAELHFKATNYLCDFVDKKVIPTINAVHDLNNFNRAFTLTFYRMQFWMLSAQKLNHPQDFQTTWNAARGMYELLIDLKMLDKCPERVDAFHAFEFVTKYKHAKFYVEEVAKHPTYVPHGHSEKREKFVNNPDNKKL